MRVVGGRHRGRRIEAPPGLDVRPTADRTREALFNLLAHGKLGGEGATLPGASVLDAFAGTGALGLEALSRGAEHAVFMEQQGAGVEAIRRNLRALGEERRASVLQADVLRPPRARVPCRVILLDPPYGQGLGGPALTALAAAGWIARGALVAVELMKDEPFSPPAGFELMQERRYGKARLVFLRADRAPEPAA